MLTAERISADKARERVRSPDPPRTDDIQHRSSKKKKVLCVDDGGSPDIGRESDEETMEMKGSILSLPTALEHEYTGKCVSISNTACSSPVVEMDLKQEWLSTTS